MERLGVRYLRRIDGARPETKNRESPGILDAEQRAEIESVFRNAITHAAIAGAVFGFAAGLAETLVHRALGVPEVIVDRGQLIRYWEVYGAVVVPLSLLEILYMWSLALRAVHRLARVSGLELTTDARGHAVAEGPAVAAIMARAALELPNPRKPILGVDPMREASRLQLALASLAYKLKAAATKFIFKAIVRRVLVRVTLRAYAPLIAAPVTAAWSAVIVWLVLREARVRALGGSAVREALDVLFEPFDETHPPSDRGRQTAVRAVAACIVRSSDLHPNLVLLLASVRARVTPFPDPKDIDDPAIFLAELPHLPPAESHLALRLLALASILDGRVGKRELRLLRDAHEAMGRTFDGGSVETMRRTFLGGKAMDRRTLDAT